MNYSKEDVAYLIGKVTGDGNLDNAFTCRFIGQEKDLIELSRLIKETFNVRQESLKITRRENIGVSYMLQVNKAFFGRILYEHGVPQGNKTLNPFLAPRWIFTKDIYKLRYLQAIFEDELCTIKIKRKNHANCPDFKQHKSLEYLDNLKEYLAQITSMLSDFGIETSKIYETKYIKKRKDGIITKGCYFLILGNKQNVIRFKEKIGFRISDKKIKALDHCYNKIVESIS